MVEGILSISQHIDRAELNRAHFSLNGRFDNGAEFTDTQSAELRCRYQMSVRKLNSQPKLRVH